MSFFIISQASKYLISLEKTLLVLRRCSDLGLRAPTARMSNATMQHPDILQFEQRAALSKTEAAAFLGVGYSAYTAWRSGRKPAPRWLTSHLRTLRGLPDDLFRAALNG